MPNKPQESGWPTPAHETENSTALGSEAPPAAPARTERPNEGGTCRMPEADGKGPLRLEKRTHLDQAHYKATITNYGNGMAEVSWSFVSTRFPIKAGKGESIYRGENEQRSVRRARSRLRKKILAAQTDHLLTLTYRENVTDFERAGADLSRFVRLVKGQLPDWVYIAIAEQQERGAWHWHMAVRGRQDVELLRATWRQVVGEGNIDVQPPKGTGKYRLLGLVKYLGKYLAKGFEDGNRELNGRRFRSSLGIEIPAKAITLPQDYYGDVTAYFLGQLCDATGTLGYLWLSEDRKSGWACSWK